MEIVRRKALILVRMMNFIQKNELSNLSRSVNYSSCVITGLVIGNLIYLILTIQFWPFSIVIYQRILKYIGQLIVIIH